MVQKMLGIREAKNGTKATKLLHARTDGHQKFFSKMVRIIQTLEEGRVPAKEAKNGRIDREKKRVARKECQRL